jgi:exosortase J
MGYALNLLRLCVLVVYYRIGISHPSIQPYGAGVDYGIGCTLFLFATLGVGLFIRWIEPNVQKTDTDMRVQHPVPSTSKPGYSTAARAACFLILVLAFIVPTIGRGSSLHVTLPSEQAALASFPSQVGPYRLIRTYFERDINGVAQYVWADYSRSQNGAEPPSQLALGLYVRGGMHLVAYSKFAQGLRPDWTGSIDAVDGSAQRPLKVHFATTLYDDGISRQYDAESVCYETSCLANIDLNARRLFFGEPSLPHLVYAPSRLLPIVLRMEWLDSDSSPAAIQRSEFEADVQQFTEQLNLRTLFDADATSM